MGGQACVLYGGAEFSRDTDLAVLADADNLARLGQALAELRAECIVVPPFDRVYLDMGLAVHFRCHDPEAEGLRLDVMSRMRGVDPFPVLWERRTTLQVGDEAVELLSLPDLVKAKKTQRDKDWPMVARLVEANYAQHRDRPSQAQVDFWLREMRTSLLLIEVAAHFPADAERLGAERSLLSLARAGDEAALGAALKDEEGREREADQAYWAPLRKELERLRHERSRKDQAEG